MNRLLPVSFAVVLALSAGAAAGPATAEKDSAQVLYGEAAAAFDSGDLELAGRRFEDFRRRYPGHQLFWQASLMWARCEDDPGEAAKRFRLVAKGAPVATRAECEMEVADLLMMQGKFKDAAAAYGDWLKAHPQHERAEAAVYWRGLSLRQQGRTAEAAEVLEPLYAEGRQPEWRGLAGLLLASMKAAAKDRDAAYDAYIDLSKAPWAADVRPQALLAAARMTKNAWQRKRIARTLERDHADTDEAEEAKKLLKESVVRGVRYGVQVGAFVNKSGARAEKERFEKIGHDATIVKRTQIGMELYAVIIGDYENRESAARKKRELRQQGHGSVFVTTY